jgi:hypothetical protein
VKVKEFSPDGKAVYAEMEIGDSRFVAEITAERTVTIPGWIVAHPTLSDRSVRLWGYLKGALNGAFSVPGTSHRSLAELMDVSVASVRRSIYELRDAGAIQIAHRFKDGKQLRNSYFLWPADPDGEHFRVLTGEHHAQGRAPVYISNNKSINIGQKSAHPSPKSQKYKDEFEQVWSIYPRRVNKARAYKAFARTLDKKIPFELLLKATTNYAKNRVGTEEQYTLHGSTFFGPDERWRDFIEGEADRAEMIWSDETLLSARIFDEYDTIGVWSLNGEPYNGNPVKHGFSRPKNKLGQLVAVDGKPYELDMQGVRHQLGYWN